MESAGTISAHTDQRPDQRMMYFGEKRGLSFNTVSRKFDPKIDFYKFDYIVVMDNNNRFDILNLDPAGKYSSKIYLMSDFSSKYHGEEVPDPYYGGDKGFELVLDMVYDACLGLVKHIKSVKNDH